MFFVFFQLVKGLRYTITAELSNTQCKKSTMLQTCDFYPESEKLKVTLIHVCLCKGVKCFLLNNRIEKEIKFHQRDSMNVCRYHQSSDLVT